jgi:membrane protein YdbS with pleckstrin-like domain
MAVTDLQTKQCPFCAETIQAKAIKCRFCGEFLNSEKAKSLLNANSQADCEQTEEGKGNERVLFAGSPSLWGAAPAVLKGLVIVVLAILLIKIPVENLLGSKLTQNQVMVFAHYRFIVGLGICLAAAFYIALNIIRLRMVYYEVTPARIEWNRGILDRKVDNLDMFRIIDLKLRRSALDCVLGIGAVVLTTTDKSDPEFVFEKVRDPRRLYDIIKKASLEADRRTSVVHLE